MKALRTWALIADSAHARILENNGPIHGDADHGASGDSAPRHDWMPVEGQNCQHDHSASRLAEILSEALGAGAYQRLIIAAPPATLGVLRKAISDKVRATVIAEFAHDLTKVPNHKIAGHLRPIPIR